MTKGTDCAFVANAETDTDAGLTKKEYFAAMFVQGLLAKYTLNTPEDQNTITKLGIELADTFIDNLNK